MKLKVICVLFMVTILVGCASAQSSPTPAFTATVTSTPPPTSTNTPIPTPVGGSGGLMLVVDQELRILNTDGSVREVVIPREEFVERFSITGDNRFQVAKISPDGKKILVQTCVDIDKCYNSKLYVNIIESSRTAIDVGYRIGILEWSPASDRFLKQGSGETEGKAIISDKAGPFVDFIHEFEASVAFWSFDGKLVYYYHENTWYVMNNDGTDLRTVECAICTLMPELSLNAVSQSPDGRRLAISDKSGTIIITTPDFAQFKTVSFDNYVGYMIWSPDGERLVVDVYKGTNESETMILAADGTLIEDLQHPDGSSFIVPCGWSPDGRLIDYLAYFPSGYKLYLYETGSQKSVELLAFEPKGEMCPIWLPTK